MKKYELKKQQIKKFDLKKQSKRHQLENPSLINCLEIINNSEFYNSTFDDPFVQGIDYNKISFRTCEHFKNNWIRLINSNDSRIKKVKQKGRYAIIQCKGGNNKKESHYIIFQDKRTGENEQTKKVSKSKKEHTTNVPHKRKNKRKSSKKSR